MEMHQGEKEAQYRLKVMLRVWHWKPDSTSVLIAYMHHPFTSPWRVAILKNIKIDLKMLCQPYDY